jgi:hypothetical protein
VNRLLLIIFLFGALLLAACQPEPAVNFPASEETVAPTQPIPAEATVAPSPTVAPEPEVEFTQESPSNNRPTGDAADEIIAALLALGDQDSFRVESTFTGMDGTETSVFEVVPPDRLRMTNEEFELLVIGNDIHVYMDGEWFQAPGLADFYRNMIFMIIDEQADELRQGITEARFLGEEMLEGENTRAYYYEVYDEEFETLGEVRLWVATSDGLPRKLETISLDPDEEDSGNLTNIYKDYNTPIRIEPPE